MGQPLASRSAEPMRTYDIHLHACGGEALHALLAEWDLDGLVVEVVLRGATLRPHTLRAILNRAPALGVIVADVRTQPADEGSKVSAEQPQGNRPRAG